MRGGTLIMTLGLGLADSRRLWVGTAHFARAFSVVRALGLQCRRPIFAKAGHQKSIDPRADVFALAFGPSSCFFSILPNACEFTMARVRQQTHARAISKSIHVLPETLTNKTIPAGRNQRADAVLTSYC